MRIHSDTLDYSHLYGAAKLAGVTLENSTHHGSRQRDHAFDVALSGNSNRRPMFYWKNPDGRYAATWDQWGVFLAELYRIDPNLTIPTAYADEGQFHYRTDYRFHIVTIGGEFPHSLSHDHSWKYTGTPRTHECRKCGAIQQWGY